MFYHFKNQRGFTLVEMIVVIAIFGIVTVVVLANLPVFRDRTSLDLVAQEVAIHLRGAQVFGAGGRVGATAERPTYGLHFEQVEGGQIVFHLFRDIPDSNGYGNQAFDNDDDCKPGNFLDLLDDNCELEQTYTVSKGFLIPLLKVNGASSGDTEPESMDILFTRPKLEPVIAINGTDTNAQSAEVIIQSVRSKECRSVKIWNNGQIAVVGTVDESFCKNKTPQSWSLNHLKLALP